MTEDYQESDFQQDIEATVKQTTNSILQEIDRIRRLEGIALLNAIAKRYGINIEILPESDARRSKRSVEETTAKNFPKRRKLNSNTANQKPLLTKQVKVKKVQGKIGYGAD